MSLRETLYHFIGSDLLYKRTMNLMLRYNKEKNPKIAEKIFKDLMDLVIEAKTRAIRAQRNCPEALKDIESTFSDMIRNLATECKRR